MRHALAERLRTPWTGNGRGAELLLILLFWTFAFVWASVRGQVAGEIPFDLIGPHRAAVACFGALLCWGTIHLFEAVRPRGFGKRMLMGLAAASVMAPLQSLFHMASCRIAPIDGVAPMTPAEAVNAGMISLAFFLAWSGMHFALVAQREKAAEQIKGKEPAVAEAPPNRQVDQVFWASRGRHTVRVLHSEIVWAEAQKDYVLLHVPGGSSMVRGTLTSLHSALDPALFVRVHRSALVRRSAIKEIRRKATGTLSVTLSGGEEVPVGRSYAVGIKALLAQLEA
jgi:hypothetical protein